MLLNSAARFDSETGLSRSGVGSWLSRSGKTCWTYCLPVRPDGDTVDNHGTVEPTSFLVGHLGWKTSTPMAIQSLLVLAR